MNKTQTVISFLSEEMIQCLKNSFSVDTLPTYYWLDIQKNFCRLFCKLGTNLRLVSRQGILFVGCPVLMFNWDLRSNGKWWKIDTFFKTILHVKCLCGLMFVVNIWFSFNFRWVLLILGFLWQWKYLQQDWVGLLWNACCVFVLIFIIVTFNDYEIFIQNGFIYKLYYKIRNVVIV